MQRYLVLLAILAVAGSACGSNPKRIPGTSVTDSRANRDIIQAVEHYRLAVERKDAAALLLMASKQYWEDGGTPTGKDDYGYDKLRDVLTGRFQKGDDLRYSLRYMSVARRCPAGADAESNDGCRAYVDVLIDASYSVEDARGETVRRDKRDQNQLVLEWDGDAWKFLSGM